MNNLAKIAEKLDEAAANVRAIEQLSTSGVPLTLDEAYRVQDLSIRRRIGRGEKLAGVKMGFTSEAKMKQMGVSDMIWGRLTDAMHIRNGGTLDFQQHIHPRVEPEIAFRLAKRLRGRVSLQEAREAVDAIAPALEIIDSRYRNFKFSLEDVVADNCSSSAFVVGDWQPPLDDLSALEMELRFDGETVDAGSSAAILGNPYRSLVAAARLAATANLALEPGFIVLAGSATAAHALTPNINVSLNVQNVGDVTMSTSRDGA